MGLKEEDIIFTRKDEQGNTVMRFPITRVENVERAVVTVEGLKPANGNVALPVMAGASATAAGKKGDVPAPAKGDQAKALLGSGKFGFPSNLATTRYFNGVAFNGGADVVNYGVCSTAAATAAKVVACAGFALKTGAHILVKFTVTNTVTPTAAAPLTLNVNNTGAKSIFYHGSAAFTASYVSANRVIEFVYDGTQYAVVGDWDTNTRYSNMTGATTSAAGKAGLVPAPAAGTLDRYLNANGEWKVPPDTKYTHPASGVTAGSYNKVTVDANGHVTKGENVTVAAVPTGTMLPFAGTSIPSGYLLCNGATVSRTTYAALFKVIGTKWGAGDGSKTFQLPDVTDRVLEGTTDGTKVGTYLEAGLPNITGDFDAFPVAEWGTSSQSDGWYGAVHRFGSGVNGGSGGGFVSRLYSFSAQSSSPEFGASSTVQPPAIQTLIIIKV